MSESPLAETPSPSTVAVDGRTVAYAEYGDPDGTPVLFLHGTPGSRVLGRLFDEAARERGVRIVAPDRPGCGQSAPWDGRTLADTGDFLAPVLDDAGVEEAGVVGFSGGGPHALAFAATHGDRVRSVDVVAGATPPSLGETARTARLLGRAADAVPWLLGGVFRFQGWVAERASPSAVVGQYTNGDDSTDVPPDAAEIVRADAAEALGTHRDGAVTESGFLAREWPVSLQRIDVPVRLWHGDRDENVPIDGAWGLERKLPDAEVTVVEDSDHLTTLVRARDGVLAAQS